MLSSQLKKADAEAALRQFIKDTRVKKAMTLRDLAAKVNLNEGYLSLIENGKRPLSFTNFHKLLFKGFEIDQFVIQQVWDEFSDENLHRQTAAKSLVMKKYKILSRGIKSDIDGDGGKSSFLSCRWVINGKIYIWNYDGHSFLLQEKDVINDTLYSSSWQVVFNSIGKKDMVFLLEALIDEIDKEDSPDQNIGELINEARNEILDIRDAFESLKEGSEL